MIKKILKYCVPAYILSGLITIITYLVITGSYHNLWGVALITIITTLFIALIITAIGLLFGLVPSILIQRPSLERIFYWVGQVLAFLVFFAWFINSIAPDFHIHKKKDNRTGERSDHTQPDRQWGAIFRVHKYDNAEYMRVYKKQEVLKAKLDKFDKAIN